MTGLRSFNIAELAPVPEPKSMALTALAISAFTVLAPASTGRNNAWPQPSDGSELTKSASEQTKRRDSPRRLALSRASESVPEPSIPETSSHTWSNQAVFDYVPDKVIRLRGP